MLLLMAAAAIAPEVFRLWPGAAPGALGSAEKDVPTLTLYKPEKPSGSAIVVFPGGGYGMLAGHEGKDFAVFLNRLGVTAFVLKYRLGSDGYRHPVMLQDAERAVRTVRSRAKEWGIDPSKIGVMGSSAGGHLATTILTHFSPGKPESSDPIEKASSRPNFGILCYAVVTMGPGTHEGSRENLLGRSPAAALLEELSNEKRVTRETPPCFIWSTGDDSAVPVSNSLAFAQALSANKVPYDLHVYPHGPHGIGLGGPPDSDKLHPWTFELKRWLRENRWSN